MIEIRRNPSRRELRLFAALVFPAFWTVVALLVLFRAGMPRVAITIAALTLPISIVGLISPAFMRWIYLGMIYATYPIGFVISHILLAIVYYLILTPIGLALALAGKDPMNRKFEANRRTYWLDKEETTDVDSYFRQH